MAPRAVRSALAPLLMAQFAISRGEVGLVQTAVYLSATWSALVGGRLADRVGERSVLIVSGRSRRSDGYRLAWLAVALAVLVGLIATLGLREDSAGGR
jgi:MFS family permease